MLCERILVIQLAETLLRLRVEHVQLPGLDGELDLVPRRAPLLRRDESDDLGPVGVCVEQLLVAEVLDDVDSRRDAHGPVAVYGIEQEVLRPEPDDDLLPPLGDGRRYNAG